MALSASVAAHAVIFTGLENNCSSCSSLLLPACFFAGAASRHLAKNTTLPGRGTKYGPNQKPLPPIGHQKLKPLPFLF